MSVNSIKLLLMACMLVIAVAGSGLAPWSTTLPESHEFQMAGDGQGKVVAPRNQVAT